MRACERSDHDHAHRCGRNTHADCGRVLSHIDHLHRHDPGGVHQPRRDVVRAESRVLGESLPGRSGGPESGSVLTVKRLAP